MADAGGWQALSLGLFRRMRADYAGAVEGIGPAALAWQVSPTSNTIGWLAWHIARVQDRNLSELTGAPQLWVAEGWAARFGRPADPSDTGFGHSAQQAAAFRTPNSNLLPAYQVTAHALAERYLAAAPDGDLTRVVDSPTLGNAHTVEERLRGLITDSFAHLGQIGLLRSLVPGHRPVTGGRGAPV
ncbi:DinB family protein [Streptomyces sp. NBC_00448]|uniref:DinB family protein n=1 Tax=Streptomyces sp. NBC_00448 TaxID=2903652 RepID=UPI002E23F07B